MDINILINTIWMFTQSHLSLITNKDLHRKSESADDAIWNAIKEKFDTKATTSEILDNLLIKPDDDDTQTAFRYQMIKFLEEDSEFADKVKNLLKDAGITFSESLYGDGAIVQGEKGGMGIGGEVNIEDGDFVAGNKILGSRRLAGDSSVEAPPPPPKKKKK